MIILSILFLTATTAYAMPGTMTDDPIERIAKGVLFIVIILVIAGLAKVFGKKK